jgi:hypothetical protein
MPNVVGPDWGAEVASILVGAGERKHQSEMQKEAQLAQARQNAFGTMVEIALRSAQSGQPLPPEVAQLLSAASGPFFESLGVEGTPEQFISMVQGATTPEAKVGAATVEDTISRVGAETRKALAEAGITEEEAANISRTIEARIAMQEAQTATEEVKPALIKAQTEGIKTESELQRDIQGTKKAFMQAQTKLQSAQAESVEAQTMPNWVYVQNAMADSEYKKTMGEYAKAQAAQMKQKASTAQMDHVIDLINQLNTSAKNTDNPNATMDTYLALIKYLEGLGIQFPLEVRGTPGREYGAWDRFASHIPFLSGITEAISPTKGIETQVLWDAFQRSDQGRSTGTVDQDDLDFDAASAENVFLLGGDEEED